jgi:hypothetical protein
MLLQLLGSRSDFNFTPVSSGGEGEAEGEPNSAAPAASQTNSAPPPASSTYDENAAEGEPTSFASPAVADNSALAASLALTAPTPSAIASPASDPTTPLSQYISSPPAIGPSFVPSLSSEINVGSTSYVAADASSNGLLEESDDAESPRKQNDEDQDEESTESDSTAAEAAVAEAVATWDAGENYDWTQDDEADIPDEDAEVDLEAALDAVLAEELWRIA